MSKYKSPDRRDMRAILSSVKGSCAEQKKLWREKRVARWEQADSTRAELAALQFLECNPREAERLIAMNIRHRERAAEWNK